jgi:predicted porin
MKKSLLALAVLGAFAGAASAQSSVTLYGRVDLSIAKNIGSKQKQMQNGSGSRLGVRGVEDLGGGLQALFNIEHRFNADTGTISAARFWNGRSLVGLQGGFGQVVLGREYTTPFLQSQLVADPWGLDTVAAQTGLVLGGIGTVRNDNSLTYKISAAGFTFGAQIAEATDSTASAVSAFQKKPVNFAVSYAAGPITAGFGHERTGASTDATAKWTTVNASYNLGMAKVGAFFGTGNTAGDATIVGDQSAKRRAWMLTATAPVGAGEFRASYGRLTNDPAGSGPGLGKVTSNQTLALGYHYSLSKRTTVYADYANNSKATTPVGSPSKSGYDVGIKHNF